MENRRAALPAPGSFARTPLCRLSRARLSSTLGSRGHMATTFELWDLQTRNALGGYATEADALAVVRRSIEAEGRAVTDDLALLRVGSRGRTKTIAIGASLAERALAVSPRGRVALPA